jgi:hypothetical protein
MDYKNFRNNTSNYGQESGKRKRKGLCLLELSLISWDGLEACWATSNRILPWMCQIPAANGTSALNKGYRKQFMIKEFLEN